MKRIKFETVICLVATLFGLILRYLFLQDAPYSLNSDEAFYYQAAARYIQEGNLYALSTSYPYPEMLAAYFYVAVDRLFGVPRLGPAIISSLEIAGVGLVALRLLGKRAALLAMALLALCPWHVFYSRITGPIMGVILMTTCITLAFGKKIWSFLTVAVIGLLYYASVKIVVFKIAIEALIKRKLNYFWSCGLAGLLALGIVWASGSNPLHYLPRGSYNFLREFTPLRNYFYYLLMPFLPAPAGAPFPRSNDARHFLDVVLYKAVGPMPITGWTVSILSLIGLISIFKKRDGWFQSFKYELITPILCIPLLGFLGPSPIHNLVLLPFLILTAVIGWLSLEKRLLSAQRFAKITPTFPKILLVLFLLVSAISSARVIAAFRDRELMRLAFGIEHKEISDWICSEQKKYPYTQYFYFTFESFFEAEFFGEKTKCFHSYSAFYWRNSTELLKEVCSGPCVFVIQRLPPQSDLNFIRPYDERWTAATMEIEQYIRKNSDGRMQSIQLQNGYEIGASFDINWKKP